MTTMAKIILYRHQNSGMGEVESAKGRFRRTHMNFCWFYFADLINLTFSFALGTSNGLMLKLNIINRHTGTFET